MLDGDVLSVLEKTMALVAKSHKALVLYNDDLREAPHKTNFSTGANIGMAYLMANIRLWGKIEGSMKDGQKLYQAMRYAPFPVVGAPAGMALGGGCEILLHCAAVQAHAESYIGLVEAGVGLVPGWGGCTTMLTRWQHDKQTPKGPMPAVAKVFEIVSIATVSRSAAEAMELKFLRPTDGITMNRDRLLADAKAKALAMAENYAPPEPLPCVCPAPPAASRSAWRWMVSTRAASRPTTTSRSPSPGRCADRRRDGLSRPDDAKKISWSWNANLHGADPHEGEPGADQKHHRTGKPLRN